MSNGKSEQAPGQNKSYSIIVNGRPKEITQKKLSYLEVVQIAFPGEQPTPQRVYTVTFSNPHGKDGTMVEGQEEVIKDDIIFNVTKTDQS